jgi:hypothetical protein
MKKIVIAIAIIVTAVTAKVGHNEYKQWSNAKENYEYFKEMYLKTPSDLENVKAIFKEAMEKSQTKINNGFWASIFNAF